MLQDEPVLIRHDANMLVLQFVSSDQLIQADCPARDWSEEDQHAAIVLGGHRRSAEEAMVRSAGGQLVAGRYIRYASRIFDSALRKRVAEGECSICVFSSLGDRDAFCLLTGAHPADFARAMATDDLP